MAKGTAYMWERQHFLDRQTGAPITQLTSFPSPTHAHPFFDPTAAAVIYQSDRTGICQVYSCRIPESLKAELSR